MLKIVTAVFLLTLVGACDSTQPFTFTAPADPGVTPDPTDPTDPDTPELSGFSDTGGAGSIPLEIANNLTNVSYRPGSNSITVTGAPLDTGTPNGNFTRNASLDVPGYSAYSTQDGPLDRMFIALVAESGNGAVEGGVVLDGGQFNRFFGGSFYRRNSTYSPGGSDVVTYAGNYAGLTNLNAPRSSSVDILPLPPGIAEGDPRAPHEPGRVSGNVLLNVDFADLQINGTIINRVMVGNGTSLVPLALITTEITAEGTFQGDVELSGDISSIGTYGGAFGGTGGRAVAGGVSITDYIDDIDNEAEYGAFVLSRCGQPGAGAQCSTVD